MSALINMPRAAWKRQPPQIGVKPINRRFINRMVGLWGGGGLAGVGTATFFGRRQLFFNNSIAPFRSLQTLFEFDYPPTVVRSNGWVGHFAGDKSGVWTKDYVGSSVTDQTLLVYCTLRSLATTQHIIGWGSNFNSDIHQYGRLIGIRDGQLLVLGSANNSRRFTAVAPSLDVPVVMAARFSSDGALFVSGVKSGSGNLASSWVYWFAMGGANGGGEVSNVLWPFTGDIYYGAAWDRGLSDAELSELTADPWVIYAPAPSRFYLIPTAPALTVPTLSSPGVTDITATAARPQVTLTY